jgi:hypothetical protein
MVADDPERFNPHPTRWRSVARRLDHTKHGDISMTPQSSVLCQTGEPCANLATEMGKIADPRRV